MKYLELCDRCKGEGRIQFPPLGRHGMAGPVTHSEASPCFRCNGTGYRQATPHAIRLHLEGTGFKGL